MNPQDDTRPLPRFQGYESVTLKSGRIGILWDGPRWSDEYQTWMYNYMYGTSLSEGYFLESRIKCVNPSTYESLVMNRQVKT